ncbi:hypothetical protein SAMN05192558_102650 [Actinokineospora alba]|uniref:Uncharacterized protein n=1 Tax=Actinokineospora alba TaxID=504798 RepID=A0A1H0IQ29_9PSEU|nr:DUF6319 family protein [Actinokineospora alba]TDP70854.1 hypothetical protein C8E96_6485 [Actinokineospora alba]SDI91681.1 hypothetical protein SAMN05421871_108349 [Actinokineospora alba]SDO33463.1 hypothetical protein SAMN05192558_102650 [Actinokineospora alba]
MARVASLSTEQVERLRGDVAAGKPAGVWFTAAAVGVTAGQSGKVVGFAEPAEGDFIQVRPTGSRDELTFSPAELTLVKPPPKPKPAPAPVVVEPVAAALPEVVVGIEPAPVVRKPPPHKPAEVTVTLHSTLEGEWTVDVLVGKKRVVRWEPVPAGDVARAAKSLPSGVGEAIGTALEAAKRRQLARVEQLKAELDAAQRALRDLG